MTHGANLSSGALRASHERDCPRKETYLSRKEARQVRRKERRRIGVLLDEYRCLVCSCWHLGNPLPPLYARSA